MTGADNTTPTRVALAYANLQKWLVGNVLGPCGVDGAGTWSCNLQFSDGRQGLILWNPNGGATVNKKLSWKPAEVEDIYGRSTPATGIRLSVCKEPVILCE